jgi:hypothetical protein
MQAVRKWHYIVDGNFESFFSEKRNSKTGVAVPNHVKFLEFEISCA